MSVSTLVFAWEALQHKLAAPGLSEEQNDTLAEQSMQMVAAVARAPSAGLRDVILKLQLYVREVEAGPCESCDTLLHAALQEQAAFVGHERQVAPHGEICAS